MATEDYFQIKNEFDDSNFCYSDEKDEERYEQNNYNESLEELTYIKTPNGDSISVNLRLGNKILFCSGKYFHIERMTDQTDHQKEYMGIVTTCHTCGVQIRGSLKVSSNFISHLKCRHPEVYKEFLKHKQGGAQGSVVRKSHISHRASPYPPKAPILGNTLKQENNEQFQRNILQFIIGTNQPLSLVEDQHFLRLFEFPLLLKKSFQYAQIIKDECKFKQLELANFFKNSDVFVCLTVDAWSFGEYKYLAVSTHWIDEQFQRQTALLACVRYSLEANRHLKIMLRDIVLRYGLRNNFIANTVTENIKNNTLDFADIGISKDALCFNASNQTDDCNGLKQIQENFELLKIEHSTALHFSQLDILKLTKIWCSVFSQKLDDRIKIVHQNFMKKCSAIWKRHRGLQNFEMLLNGSLTPPNLLCFTSFFKALKQLQMNKPHLTQIYTFLENSTFNDFEMEYLDELTDTFEPLNAAFEFLEKPENNFFGCFLPTLVTLKWRLTRLHNSRKFNYLQDALLSVKNLLLTEFKAYFELNETKAEAIIAAITYPPVKTRFLNGLQETVSWGNLQARNFLLKFGKDFHESNESQMLNNAMSSKQENGPAGSKSAIDFFDFGDGQASIQEEYEAPVSLKLEIDTYLADGDNTLNSLQKYPTVKQMFLRFNTCIPSPASVLRLFPLPKIIKMSLLNNYTDEQFEDYIFYQSHLLDKM